MTKEILDIFKKENLYGKYIDCDNKIICKVVSKFGRRKIIPIEYPLFDIIKLNNNCNYFTFREHIHDVKSHINASYGLLSILEYDINNNPSKDMEPIREQIKEIAESIETLTQYTTERVRNYEKIFSGRKNLSEALIFYLSSYVNIFIIDEKLDNDFDNCYRIVKSVIDTVKEKNLKEIIIKLSNNNIKINDLEGNDI